MRERERGRGKGKERMKKRMREKGKKRTHHCTGKEIRKRPFIPKPYQWTFGQNSKTQVSHINGPSLE